MPQHSRSKKTPLGLTPYQSPQICLKPGQIGYIPPMQTPAVKVDKTEVPPRVSAIPYAMILPKPQNNK